MQFFFLQWIGVWCPQAPTYGGYGDLWLKNVFLIVACDDTILKKWLHFSLRLLTLAFLDPPPKKTPTSGCRWDFWTKKLVLILACNDTILTKKKMCLFLFKFAWFFPNFAFSLFCPYMDKIGSMHNLGILPIHTLNFWSPLLTDPV